MAALRPVQACLFGTFIVVGSPLLLFLLVRGIPADSGVRISVAVKKDDQARVAEVKKDERQTEPEAFPEPLELTRDPFEMPELSEPHALSERVDEVVGPGPAIPPEAPAIEPKKIPMEQDVIPEPKGVAEGDSWTGAFPNRSGVLKDKLLSDGGGNKMSETTVAAGLHWLALHQAQDGHWSLNKFNENAREKPFPEGKTFKYDYGNTMGLGTFDDDVAATGLALLPFLGAGLTHKAEKVPQKIDYHKCVMEGLNYLMKQQDATTGKLSKKFYSHGIASFALIEAYAMTSDPLLKGPAQKSLDYISANQNEDGGWPSGGKEASDLMATGWQLMALKTGQMCGLRVPFAVVTKAESFVNSCEVKDTGTYSFTPGSVATPSMTATGMLCRQYLGINPRNAKLGKGIEFIKKNPPSSQDLYYLYNATQVMRNMGGDTWTRWNEGPNRTDGIRDTLIGARDLSPDDSPTAMLRGSWNYTQGHCAAGGRLMSTSFAVLCLEAYYRYLPIYGEREGVTEIKPGPDK